MASRATPDATPQVLEPLTKRKAWKALQPHYEKVRGLHLRKLFADDPKRGERMTAEAAGLFLDYSKNRITDETLKLLIDLAEEARVFRGIGHHHGFAVLGHPAGNSLPDLDAHVFQRRGGFPDRQLEIQFLLGLIEEQQRPVFRAQKFIDLLHDGAENLIELQRRRQRLPQLLEDRDLARLALFVRNGCVTAAFNVRKLLYFLHARLNLSFVHFSRPGT